VVKYRQRVTQRWRSAGERRATRRRRGGEAERHRGAAQGCTVEGRCKVACGMLAEARGGADMAMERRDTSAEGRGEDEGREDDSIQYGGGIV
jgi:hypothetical protein